MKKIMNWVLAATLICGTTTITACSSNSDDDNNAPQEQAKTNRKEFIEHTRATLKDLAENLNFTSWESANDLNLYFNQYVLNNPNFNRVVGKKFVEDTQKPLKPVEEGSELAEMGYTQYAIVDFSEFNYRFTETIDHATAPMSQSIIVMRQLMMYVNQVVRASLTDGKQADREQISGTVRRAQREAHRPASAPLRMYSITTLLWWSLLTVVM